MLRNTKMICYSCTGFVEWCINLYFFFFSLHASVYFETFQLRPGCNDSAVQPTPGGSHCEAALGLVIVWLPGPGLAVCGLVVQELWGKDDLITISPISVIVKYVNVVIPLFWCVQVDPLDFIIVPEEIKMKCGKTAQCSHLCLLYSISSSFI